MHGPRRSPDAESQTRRFTKLAFSRIFPLCRGRGTAAGNSTDRLGFVGGRRSRHRAYQPTSGSCPGHSCGAGHRPHRPDTARESAGHRDDSRRPRRSRPPRDRIRPAQEEHDRRNSLPAVVATKPSTTPTGLYRERQPSARWKRAFGRRRALAYRKAPRGRDLRREATDPPVLAPILAGAHPIPAPGFRI